MFSAGRGTARRGVQVVQRRSFFGVKSPVEVSPAGVFVTKYRIVRPGKEGTDWDDFLILQPDKEQLASSAKDVPLFIKYLRIVTDKENRNDDFKEFVKRAKDGLQVESDVYITTEELLAVMWKNGYADKERTSLQYTFPADYKFHYPELAVLFNLSEEDTYKYCMRTRMEASHIGQVQSKKVMKMGWVRDHWLLFGAGAFIFKTFPFFNYYFVLKGFGTAMWCWTFYTAFSRWHYNIVARNEFMAQQKTASDVMEGEDKIMAAMKRFGNDSKCLESLADFKKTLLPTMADYRKALVQNEKNNVIAKAQKQLQAIQSFEDSSGARLQESIVAEIGTEFRDKFVKDKGMQSAAFDSALQSISGKSDGSDPLTSHFLASLKSLDLSGGAKANKAGSVNERLAYLQQQQEDEFNRTFYVTKAEADSVKGAKSDPVKLEALMVQLYGKVGFHVPDTFAAEQAVAAVGDSAVGDKYVSEVNEEAKTLAETIKKKQLDGFAASFA